ncbi:adenylate/guanylate cyclase domain-containing protein [bacterium]|nr:MAG: adenylate/guanylate cyclase domain-containing protein [bacterium]
MMNFPVARLWLPLFLLLLLEVVGLWARFQMPLLEGFELRLIDARFAARGPKPPSEIADISQQVAVVAMDDKTLNRFGNPLPRDVHARMVEHLRQAGARAVLFDVMFLDASRREPTDDTIFARSTQKAGNVFLPFDNSSTDPAPPATLLELAKRATIGTKPGTAVGAPFRPPYPTLFNAARGVGHVDTQSDLDGRFRRSVLALEEDGAIYPHLALMALADQWGVPRAQIALKGDMLHVGEHLFGPLQLVTTRQNGHTQRKWLLPLDFAGGRDTMDKLTYSYSDVLDGKDDAQLKGRIVIVGETATGTPDLRPSPFDDVSNFVGVHTNATLLANLAQNDYLHPASPTLNLLLAVACGLCSGLMALALRPLWSFTCGVLLGFLVFLFSALAFLSQNLVIETTAPLLCISLCYVGMVGFRSATFEREARMNATALLETQTLLGYIVNPRLAQELASDSEKRLDLQIGARREVSVLFCDIRGFTQWCETRSPEEVKSRLDDYFPLMCEICEDDFDGFLDKFIGDAVMVVWNAHRDHPDHAIRAVRAGLAMQRGLALLNDGWKKQGLQPFTIGVGIASGEAIWGTFGAANRKVAPTVLGDTVNMAARMEGLSKEFGPVVISQKTMEAIGDTFSVRFMGDMPIKGKVDLQSVYVVDL